MTLPKNNLAINMVLLLSILAISCTQAQTSSTICFPTSPQCCWVKRSWELMGKRSSVNANSATACCNFGIPGVKGVKCTSTGIVTEIKWGDFGLKPNSAGIPIPAELGKLTNLQSL